MSQHVTKICEQPHQNLSTNPRTPGPSHSHQCCLDHELEPTPNVHICLLYSSSGSNTVLHMGRQVHAWAPCPGWVTWECLALSTRQDPCSAVVCVSLQQDLELLLWNNLLQDPMGHGTVTEWAWQAPAALARAAPLLVPCLGVSCKVVLGKEIHKGEGGGRKEMRTARDTLVPNSNLRLIDDDLLKVKGSVACLEYKILKHFNREAFGSKLHRVQQTLCILPSSNRSGHG